MIYVSDLGNEIFPGRINGGCYTFRKKEAKIEQYCLNFREYVTEISQIFPYSQIVVFPTFGRRYKKCTYYCNRCISYENYEETLVKINSMHKINFHNSKRVSILSYETLYTEFFKQKPLFQSRPVVTLTESLLQCKNCRGKRTDNIHICCNFNLIRYASAIESLICTSLL